MTQILDPVADSSPAAFDLVLDPRRDRLDWALAGADDPQQPLGLRAGQTLATAIALCFWSDARGEPDILTPGELDLRGWPGDGFDIDETRGEAPLGATTWTRFRYPADQDNADEISRRMTRSLDPLVRQGLLAPPIITGEASPAANRIGVKVLIAAPSGRVIFDGPFSGLWETLLGTAQPLGPDAASTPPAMPTRPSSSGFYPTLFFPPL